MSSSFAQVLPAHSVVLTTHCVQSNSSLLKYAEGCPGGMRERLKRVVLKTTVPERVPGVRIPLPPPRSLGCRETRLHSSGNRSKTPQFRGSCPQTGPGGVSSCTLQARLSPFFSGRLTSSPVLTTPSGECNAITNRAYSESDLTFANTCAGNFSEYPARLHRNSLGGSTGAAWSLIE
jgi:hypothetical protein